MSKQPSQEPNDRRKHDAPFLVPRFFSSVWLKSAEALGVDDGPRGAMRCSDELPAQDASRQNTAKMLAFRRLSQKRNTYRTEPCEVAK